MAFCFLQRLSAFFNGFPISSMAFRFSSTAFRFSSTAFRFSSTAFLFPRNPRKSIYGGKYMKDHHLSFVFPATCSPSFVIATCSPSFIIATRSPSFVIATCSPSFIITTMRASHPTAPPNIWLRHYESNVGPNTVGNLVCCAPNNMVASASYGCTTSHNMVAPLGPL